MGLPRAMEFNWSTELDQVPISITQYSSSVQEARNDIRKIAPYNCSILEKLRDDNSLNRYRYLLNYICNNEPTYVQQADRPSFTIDEFMRVTPFILDE